MPAQRNTKIVGRVGSQASLASVENNKTRGDGDDPTGVLGSKALDVTNLLDKTEGCFVCHPSLSPRSMVRRCADVSCPGRWSAWRGRREGHKHERQLLS